MNADKAKPAKPAPKELDVDGFLNGGFMSMDTQQDRLSDSGESEDEAGSGDAIAMDSDAEQDARDMTSAPADAGSESESGMSRTIWPQLQFALHMTTTTSVEG